MDIKDYYEKSHAIIIGINQYREENSLTNAGNDARSIMKVLQEKYGFSVLMSMFDEEATGQKIREILDDVLNDDTRIGPKDRVLIYYSGHGKIRTIFGHGGEEIKEGYIVPYDSRKELYSSNIKMKTIIESCQSCLAKHVLLILDCCYSGFAAMRSAQLPKPQEATEEYVKDIASRIAIQVFAAGQEDKPVSDSGIRPGYSAFTGALLDILEADTDPDNDGILTASEIGFNLEREVSRQEQSQAYQRPVYSHIAGSQGGDFIFNIEKISKQAKTNNSSITNQSTIKKTSKLTEFLSSVYEIRDKHISFLFLWLRSHSKIWIFILVIVIGSVMMGLFAAQNNSNFKNTPNNFLIANLSFGKECKSSSNFSGVDNMKCPVPGDMAVNPVTNMVYVSMSNNTLSILDGKTNRIIDHLSGISLNQLAVNPVTNLIYTFKGGYSGGTITVIDGKTNLVTKEIKLPVNQPTSIAVNPRTNVIYVTNSASYYSSKTKNDTDSIIIIDGKTDEIIDNIKILGRPGAMSLNPNTNRIYVSSYGNYSNITQSSLGILNVIDGQKNQLVGTLSLPADIGAGLAVNPNTNTIYVGMSYDTVSIINGTSNEVVRSISVGPNPDSISIDPNTNRTYIATGISGIMSIINGTTNNVIKNVPIGSGLARIVVDPNTSLVYIINRTALLVIDAKLL